MQIDMSDKSAARVGGVSTSNKPRHTITVVCQPFVGGVLSCHNSLFCWTETFLIWNLKVVSKVRTTSQDMMICSREYDSDDSAGSAECAWKQQFGLRSTGPDIVNTGVSLPAAIFKTFHMNMNWTRTPGVNWIETNDAYAELQEVRWPRMESDYGISADCRRWCNYFGQCRTCPRWKLNCNRNFVLIESHNQWRCFTMNCLECCCLFF